MKSLAGRLSAALAISLVLLLALQWLIASIAISRLTEQLLVARLSKDAESLLTALRANARGDLQLEPARVSPRYQRPFSGYYYTVATSAGREASRSLWDTAFEVPAVDPGATLTFRGTGPEKQPLLVVVHGYRKLGRTITIAVAENLTELNAGLKRFQLIHGVVSVVVLLALLLVQRLIVRGGLRPLEAVQRNMERLGRGEVARIDVEGPAEVAPLIAQLNRLLATMGKRSRRSREALGNLAHALKTRLAILNQMAERPEFASHLQARTEIRESTGHMRRIVERELKRARLMGASLPGERVNLRDELTLLSKTLKALYADKALKITWGLDDRAVFLGDREDLMELLGNLLDNACKWCRREVSLNVSADDGIAFVVEDDGPGCTAEEMDMLTRRGFRVDESAPGSGLGLAIVRDVVESYDGKLVLERSAVLGGLRVEVRLPEPGDEPA